MNHLATLDPATVAILGLVVVLVVALVRPTGPVMVYGDLSIQQEARVNAE